MRADKAKVVDEVWDDARIEGFLDKQNMGSESAEFSQLLNAYRSMRVEDFARFIAKFRAAGGAVDAQDRNGRTLAQIVTEHRKGQPFLAVLQQAE